MQQVFDALGKLIAGSLNGEHWPFFSMAFTLSIIGEIMRKRVFTRERAKLYFGKSSKGQLAHWFWHFGRESMPFHPFLVCLFVLTPYWPDPEGKGYTVQETGSYWLFCAAVSLLVWVVLKSFAKEKGIILELPGDSFRPPASEIMKSIPPAAAKVVTNPPDDDI